MDFIDEINNSPEPADIAECQKEWLTLQEFDAIKPTFIRQLARWGVLRAEFASIDGLPRVRLERGWNDHA